MAPVIGVSSNFLNLSISDPELLPIPITSLIRCAVGILITHSLLLQPAGFDKIRSVATRWSEPVCSAMYFVRLLQPTHHYPYRSAVPAQFLLVTFPVAVDVPASGSLDPARQTWIFDFDIRSKLYSAYPAAFVLIEQLLSRLARCNRTRPIASRLKICAPFSGLNVIELCYNIYAFSDSGARRDACPSSSSRTI